MLLVLVLVLVVLVVLVVVVVVVVVAGSWLPNAWGGPLGLTSDESMPASLLSSSSFLGNKVAREWVPTISAFHLGDGPEWAGSIMWRRAAIAAAIAVIAHVTKVAIVGPATTIADTGPITGGITTGASSGVADRAGTIANGTPRAGRVCTPLAIIPGSGAALPGLVTVVASISATRIVVASVAVVGVHCMMLWGD